MDEPRLLTEADFLEKADSSLKPHLKIEPVDVPYHADFLAAF
jgi:hypothetical protein